MPSESIPAVAVFFHFPSAGLLPAEVRSFRVMFYERRKSYIAYNQLFIDILHFFCSNFNLHQVSR